MVKVKRGNKRKPILHAVNSSSRVLEEFNIRLYKGKYITVLRDLNGFVKGWHKGEFNIDNYVELPNKTFKFCPK